MELKKTLGKAGAARVVATTFGLFAGIGGLTHGIGEIQQGNVAADGLFVDSWTSGPIADNMGGDPGLTIVPNMLATGILATVISIVLILFTIIFVHRRHGASLLALLSFLLLLFGGGVGPPVTGLLAAVAATGIHSEHNWLVSHMPYGIKRIFAAAWPWVFAVSVVNGLYLFLGSIAVIYVFDTNVEDVSVASFFMVVVLLIANIFTGAAYDMRSNEMHGNRGRGTRQRPLTGLR